MRFIGTPNQEKYGLQECGSFSYWEFSRKENFIRKGRASALPYHFETRSAALAAEGMKATDRAHNFGTYFVTVNCASKRRLFHVERNAELMFEVLQAYREHYKLHSFVIMPDHLHVLLTPARTLEHSMQLIKGGFSFRYHKELGGLRDVWQKRYTDHRCRDVADYEMHKRYIEMNPVVAGLCEKAEEYAWSSVSARLRSPQGLKPLI